MPSFPTTLDTFTNPTATDEVSIISHSGQHSDANDAIEALESKIGIDGSAVAASLDYLIKNTSAKLGKIASLAVTDGNIIVGDGGNWVAESGATARTSLGLGTGDSPTFTNIIATGDVYNVALTDYAPSSTITGWSGSPSASIFYKKIGKLVFVKFFITGTSNATTVSFTLPYTSSNAAGTLYNANCIIAEDNSAYKTAGGLVRLLNNSNTATCYSDMAYGAWTNSGEKTVIGEFSYETV